MRAALCAITLAASPLAAQADNFIEERLRLVPATERTGVVMLAGGYDQLHGSPLLAALAEVTVWDRMSVQASLAQDDDDPRMRALVQVRALDQDRAGVDVSFAGGYEGTGFNTVPAILARAGVGRQQGRLRLASTATVGIGLEADERYGELSAYASYPLTEGVFGNLGATGEVDLERDADEPEGEPDWQLRAGPGVAVELATYVLSAQVAAQTTRYRLTGVQRSGVSGLVGVGRVF